jgi:hypothetical protein
MELDITPAFPTFIGRLRLPDAETMNEGLYALILADESEYPSLGRSNIGGWHSRPDFFPSVGQQCVRIDLMDHLGSPQNDLRIDWPGCFHGYALHFGMGNGLSRRYLPCAPLTLGQCVVRSVLRR